MTIKIKTPLTAGGNLPQNNHSQANQNKGQGTNFLTMKKMLQKALPLAMVVLALGANAQVKVGINPTVIDTSNFLEVEGRSGNKISVDKNNAQLLVNSTSGSGALVFKTNGVYGGYINFNENLNGFNHLMMRTTGNGATAQDIWLNTGNAGIIRLQPGDHNIMNVTSNGVGIGYLNTTPNVSAILDIKSTTQGLLIPKMSNANMLAIANPAGGLMVMDTSYGPSVQVNIGTAAAPVWRTSTNLSAGYSISTDYSMGFNTNGGGYFSSSALYYSGAGTSGFSYGTGKGSAGGYVFSDGGDFKLSTFAPGSGNATWAAPNAFIVKNNGSVGIGSFAPDTASLLEVVGRDANKVIVDKAGGSLNLVSGSGTTNALRFTTNGVAGGYINFNENNNGINHLMIRTQGNSAKDIYLNTGNAGAIRLNPGDGGMMAVTTTGVAIGTATPTSKLQVVGLPVYANNAAALTAGLTAGAFYHNGDGIVRVVF